MPFLADPARPPAIARPGVRGDNRHAVPPSPDTPPRALEQARRVLRCHREGALLVDGAPRPCRFVIDPATGELVLRVGV